MTISLFRSICFIALVGYSKLLVAKIIHLLLRSQGSEGKYAGSMLSASQEWCAPKAEKYDFILCFTRFILPLPALSICLLMDAYFRICSTLATSTGRCMWIVIRPFRGGEVIWVSQIKTYKIEIPRNRCGCVEFLLYFWSNPLTSLSVRKARSGWVFFI